MHAVLRVVSTTVQLCADGAPWVSRVPNPVPPDEWYRHRGDLGSSWSKFIPNPKNPTYQVTRNTYANSELPADLDGAIVENIKALERQKVADEGGDVVALDDSMQDVRSINQIGMLHFPSVLDDVNVHLPLMLDWMAELGWTVAGGDGKVIILRR